jgi:hypothetical protein
MVAFVYLSRGVLTVPHVALFGSPRAVAARTWFRRADGVLEGVGTASLEMFPVWVGSVGWVCGVSSSGGPVLVLYGWLIGVRGPASIMLTSGMGGWSRYSSCVASDVVFGEGDPSGEGEGCDWARVMRRPSVMSSFPAGLGEVKMEGDRLIVMRPVFEAGVERVDGVGGGGVGLPESSSDGSSTICDPGFG